MNEFLEILATIGRVGTVTGVLALFVRLQYSMRRTTGGKVWGVISLFTALSVAGYGLALIYSQSFQPTVGFIAWINLSTAFLYWSIAMHKYHSSAKPEEADNYFLGELYEKAKEGSTSSHVEGARGKMRDFVVTVDDIEKAYARVLQFRKSS